MLTKEMYLLSCKSVVLNDNVPALVFVFVSPGVGATKLGTRVVVAKPHDMMYSAGRMHVKEKSIDNLAFNLDAWADENTDVQLGIGLSLDEFQVATFDEGRLICSICSDAVSYTTNIVMPGVEKE